MMLNRRQMLQSAALVGAGIMTIEPARAAETAARGGGDPVAVVVTLEVEPGREDEFLDLLLPVLDTMRHEKTFMNAVLHRDPENPSRFMVYETWADRKDLVEVQVKRDYRQAYTEALPRLLRNPRGIQVWKPLRADFAFFAAAEPEGGAGRL